MGYFCFICRRITDCTTIKILIHHFHYRHGLTAMQKCTVTCGQLECSRTFDGIHALRMHLKRHHSIDPYPTPTSSCCETINCHSSQSYEMLVDDDCLDETGSENEVHCNKLSIDHIQNMFGDFLIVLKSKNVAQTTIDFVCQGFINILLAVTQFCSAPLDCKIDETYAARLHDIEAMCDNISVNSNYKILKYLRDFKKLVEPSEIFLGNRIESVRNDDETEMTFKFVPETMQYISVISTLQKLLRDTNFLQSFPVIRSHILSVNETCTSTQILNTFSDGEYYKEHKLGQIDRNFLQLHFFYDEFETANPLGSKKNVHKLGGLYMSVRNMPAQLTSRQMNIFPVIYCYASDVKKYGFDAMLQPLLSDLKALEAGIQLTINATAETIYGAAVMWSGDNLGNHQMFGFSPNFIADRCCHFCYASYDDRQTCFRESDVLLRDKISYAADCNKLLVDPSSAKISGVYRRCSLADLKFFSVPENLCPDAMHDLLEGCLQYELKLVLRRFILVDKITSLSKFNCRLLSFTYGVDSKNKPQPISLEKLQGKEKKLGMNASQAWCFARYFCLLVGDFLDESYTYMQLIYILLDIVDIVFSPNITVSMTYRLEELIHHHHQLFRTLFPEQSLIPKQHFLIHYPSKIRKLGPCVQYWCMRFESKHSSAKEFCHLLHNFKNICKSIAWKQQIRLCTDWMMFNQSTIMDIGPGSAILPCTLSVPEDVFKKVGISIYEEMYFANYVKVNGCKFQPGSIIIVAIKDDMPVFGKVLFIANAERKITFVFEKQYTLRYLINLHAYEVSSTDDIMAIDYSQLLDYHPLSLHFGFGKNRQCTYVVPRYEILCLSM